MARQNDSLGSVWSGIVRGAGVATFMVGAIWAVLTYSHGNRLAFEKPLIDKQMAICFEVSDVVGTLASTSDAAVFEQKRQEFLRYYWGPMNLIESPEVATAMGGMKAALEAGGFNKRDTLGNPSREVALQCRKQIELILSERWRLSLKDVLGIDVYDESHSRIR